MTDKDDVELFRQWDNVVGQYVEKHRAMGHQVWWHRRGPFDYAVQCTECAQAKLKQAEEINAHHG